MNLRNWFDLTFTSKAHEEGLEWAGSIYTFGEIDARSNRMARALTARGLSKGDSYRSFPSGHSVAAFAAAAAVVNETSRWWPNYTWLIGPAMYGGAGVVGVSRMYNNRHWASDVITGAAIGTFAGLKVVQWHHSHPRNRIDRIFLGTTVGPGVAGTTVVKLNFLPWF